MAPYGKTQTSPFLPVFTDHLPPMVFRVEVSASLEVQPGDRRLFAKLSRWLESKRPEELTPLVLMAFLRACAEECPELMPLLAEWAGFPDRKAVRHG
jgi:hypothetical protein